MKTCCTCGIEKDSDCFPVRQIGKIFKRIGKCRECVNEYYREKLKNPIHQHSVKKNRRNKILEIQEIKLEKGCERCGYNKCPTALQFHHLDPSQKDFSISWSTMHQLSLSKIIKEINKCIILCSNCHFEEEYRLKVKQNECYRCGTVKDNNSKYCDECQAFVIKKKKISFCSCGKVKTKISVNCGECAKIARIEKGSMPSKEELAEMVPNIPMKTIGLKYGVSDTAVIKWCKKCGIDRPGRGYWQIKLKGKKFSDGND